MTALAEPVATLAEALGREPPRLWSLVVTFYGDVVLPRGGSLWLGTLSRVVEALGVSDGALRTAMFRLASDGWLERTRLGRRSFYRLSGRGRDTFAQASRRIYGKPRADWGGTFTLALLAGEAGMADSRDDAGLFAQAGWGSPAAGIWIAPDAAEPPSRAAVRMTATAERSEAVRIAAAAWPLARTAESYRQFLDAFGPVARDLGGGSRLRRLDALVLRLLLVHAFRRIVLRDPGLPAPLLPADWPGQEARGLSRTIYRAALRPSEAWLDQYGTCESGPLPAADPAIRDRFG